MLTAALQAEVAAFIDAHSGEVDENGRRLVVRNGSHNARQVVTSAAAVGVRQPRVNDKPVDEASGERKRFISAILPTWARKSPQLAEVLPLLYLHGLSTSDFTPTLEQFLDTGAGLLASAITRLTTQWQNEARAFNERSLGLMRGCTHPSRKLGCRFSAKARAPSVASGDDHTGSTRIR